MPDGPVAVPRLSLTRSPISTIGPPLEIPTPKTLATPVELVPVAFAVLPLIVLSWTVNELVTPKSSSAPITAATPRLNILVTLCVMTVLVIVPPSSAPTMPPCGPTSAEVAA